MRNLFVVFGIFLSSCVAGAGGLMRSNYPQLDGVYQLDQHRIEIEQIVFRESVKYTITSNVLDYRLPQSSSKVYQVGDPGVTVKRGRLCIQDLKPFDFEQGSGDEEYYLDPDGNLMVQHVVFSYWQFIWPEKQSMRYFRVKE